MTDEDRVMAVKRYLEEARAETVRLLDQRRDAHGVVRSHADRMDRLLARLYDEAIAEYGSPIDCRAALVAQGGYGRQELCLYSDLDLLFLTDGKVERFVRFLTERILQSLWDAGLEVGFATRSVPDCRRLMDRDSTILTALVDCRFLSGDRSLYQSLTDMFQRYWKPPRHRDRFFQMKREEVQERMRHYGGSVYLLEPNVKEGEGGLRDFHTLYWLTKVAEGIGSIDELPRRLSPSAPQGLWKAVNFFWLVRNQLHRLAGRRQDQLLFEYQSPLAEWLGFKDSEQSLAVESFMQNYYKEAATLHRLLEKVVKMMEERPTSSRAVESRSEGELLIRQGRLTIGSSDLFWRQPLLLLKIYQEARRLGLELDESAKEAVVKGLPRIDDSFRSGVETTALFREMLQDPIGLGKMLGQMHETHLLGSFLPEFGKLHFRVQHDIYHVYTVDIHSLFAVEELGCLVSGASTPSCPTFAQVARDVERKDLLAFAILYHDIGKGEGRGHVEKGAPLIRQAGERLGFPPADLDVLEFLERSHLIMTHLAFRRDLEDPQLVARFAKSIPSLELLNMLVVQTFCDVRAVGPETMTDWKASLLEYLYLKTREVILKGSFTPERISSQLPRIRQEVSRRLPPGIDGEALEEFFRSMPPRYFQATRPSQIPDHLRLWQRRLQEPVVLEARPLEREGSNEATLLTLDSPALFSKVTGIFAAHHINILGAELAVSRQGYALQVFRVVDHQGEPIADNGKWERVKSDLEAVLKGEIRVEELVADRFRPSLFKRKSARLLPTRIEIDNDLSAYYTVIDVYAHDRIGLLYQITSTLAALGLYVEVSKISTKVDQVADTFYVKDIFGHKITDGTRIARIRETLSEVVNVTPTPGWQPPRFL